MADIWELPTQTSRKQESTVKGIKTCHVSNSMNGTYDDVLKENDHNKNSYSDREHGGRD
jgi:hypothetical protein